MKRLIVLIVTLLIAVDSMAIPIITATSGTISNNSSVNVSGNGLPSKSRGKLLLWADAQSGVISPNSSVSVGTTLSNENMTVDTGSNKRWGNGSFKSTAAGSVRVATLKPSAITTVTYNTRILISWWEKSTISAYLPENWKAGVRWWVGTAGSPHYPSHYFLSLAQNSVSTSDIRENIELPTSSQSLGSGYGFPTSTYRRIMALYEMNSSIGSSDGKLSIYKNNTLVKSYTNLKFNDSSTSPAGRSVGAFANVPYFQHVMASGSWPIGESWWVTDLALDDSWGRYEIGNASTYAACTQLEIQPFTAASASNATISIRTGTITGSKWLYACDNDNNCSAAGFPLTSGGSPAPSATSISPDNGLAEGNTLVHAFGSDFVATPQVTVNGLDATSETFISSTEITFRTPAGVAGTTNDVIFINPDSQSVTLSPGFSYDPAEATINPVTEVFPWIQETP